MQKTLPLLSLPRFKPRHGEKGATQTELDLACLLSARREGEPYPDTEEEEPAENGTGGQDSTSTKRKKQLDLWNH